MQQKQVYILYPLSLALADCTNKLVDHGKGKQ